MHSNLLTLRELMMENMAAIVIPMTKTPHVGYGLLPIILGKMGDFPTSNATNACALHVPSAFIKQRLSRLL
jgi:hypothetical protein